MPMMKLHRTHVLRTTSGHTINFEKGEEVFVPPMVVKQAVAIGAIAVDEQAQSEIDGEFKEGSDEKTVSLTPEQRTGKLREVLEGIAARNDNNDFKASGKPKVAAVQAQLDFKIEAKDIDELWDDVKRELESAGGA